MRNALVSLFETPIPQSDATARTVLSKVLGNPAINFDKPLLDFDVWYAILRLGDTSA